MSSILSQQKDAVLVEQEPENEMERLRRENAHLRKDKALLSDYIRSKTNQLLRVMGTATLQPEELDDATLVEVDPIGIVAESFQQVLEHLRETNEDLDEARQNLQAVFDSVGVGIMVVDADMHIVSFNRKMREWFDIDDSAIGKSCRGVVCDGAQPRNGCIFHDVMVSRRGERCGDTVLGDRHYQAMAAPIKNARGEIDRVIIVYADITDRKRMEDVLREAQIRMHSIFASVQAGIILVDCETREIVHANPAAEDITGYRLHDMVGHPCQGFICPTPKGQCPVLDLGETVERTETEILRADDRSLPILKTIVPIDLDGRPHLLETFVEITELKHMEESLRQALTEVQSGRERIDAIVRSIGDGVVVTDTEDRVVLMNPAAEEFFKVSLVGKNIHDAGSLFEDQRLYQNLVSALTSSETEDFHRTSSAREKSRVLQGRSSVIRDLGGRERGHVLTLRDLTREREVERLKREFVSNAGHELQTPLTAIIGFSELLIGQEELPEETRQECLRFINEKGEELSAIVDNLLDINRIASGCRLQLHPEKCDLRRLASEVLEPFRSKFIKHDFVLDFPPESLLYRVDPQKLKKVLEGLLSNAVKFSPEGGKVRLLCKRLGDGFELSISDEGIGMAPEQVQRMFEVFYRGHTSNPAFSGTGLGLAIVKEMVDAHGGKIWVDSQPGQGTSFHVKIPLLDNSDAWSPPFRV